MILYLLGGITLVVGGALFVTSRVRDEIILIVVAIAAVTALDVPALWQSQRVDEWETNKSTIVGPDTIFDAQARSEYENLVLEMSVASLSYEIPMVLGGLAVLAVIGGVIVMLVGSRATANRQRTIQYLAPAPS